MHDTGKQKAPGKRLGQGMWMIFWVLLLAVLLYYFGDREEQQRYPNQNPQHSVSATEAQLQLVANRYGHYTLPGRINGRKVRFLIDTGASDVVIPGSVAESLGLTRGFKQRVRTANGEIEVYRTRIALLELGPIALNDIIASINPHMDGEVLLGMSALKSLELTHKNNRLLLKQIR